MESLRLKQFYQYRRKWIRGEKARKTQPADFFCQTMQWIQGAGEADDWLRHRLT